MNRCAVSVLTLMIAGTVLLAPAASADLYRFRDQNGVTVIAYSIPPNMVKNGFEIIDGEGRVIKIVPRQLTEDELIQRDARMRAEAEAIRRMSEQTSTDGELLRLYSSPQDVADTRDRMLSTISDSIDVSARELDRLQEDKRNMQRRAAGLERRGQEVPDTFWSELAVLEKDIRRERLTVANRREEQDSLRAHFKKEIERVTYLLRLNSGR